MVRPMNLLVFQEQHFAALEQTARALPVTAQKQAKGIRDLIKNSRASFKRFAEAANLDYSTMAIEDFRERFEELSVKLSVHMSENGSSSSAHISRVKKALKWAAAGGSLKPDENKAMELGYPSITEFIGAEPNAPARTFARRFYAFAATSRIMPADVNEAVLNEFKENCGMREKARNRGMLHFRQNWQRMAKRGKLPHVTFPMPVSRKPKTYGLSIHELPHALREEIEAMLQMLTGENLRELKGRKPLSKNTAGLACDWLLNLLGHVQNHLGVSLIKKTLADLLTVDNVRSLINYTNVEAMQKYGIEADLGNGKKRYGRTQVIIAMEMASIAERWLRDQVLTARLKKLTKNTTRCAEDRRKKTKAIGALNDYFYVARMLLVRSDAPHRKQFGKYHRAILRRDALLFVLLATFAYREHIFPLLDTGTTVMQEPEGNICINLEKERTKPRLRDLSHEIPQEYQFLFRLVLSERKRIAKKYDKDAVFVSSRNSPLTTAGIYDIVEQRTKEILGEPRNPHLVRSAWITEFLLWSNGDYATASEIADTCRATMQRAYKKVCEAIYFARFDKDREQAASRARAVIERSNL